MENTAPKVAYTTPEQLDALRRNQTQRLRDMAEGLIRACEGVEVPKDMAGIERAAKVIVTLNTMMKTLYEAKTSMAGPLPRSYYDDQLRRMVTPPAPTADDDAATLQDWWPGLTARLKCLEDMRKERKTYDDAEAAVARHADG